LIPAHRSRLAGLSRELVALDQGECMCISAIIFNYNPKTAITKYTGEFQ
jgi:hypothetical protein